MRSHPHLLLAALVAAASLSSSSLAAPKPGELVPSARVESLDGKSFDSRSAPGKLTLIFYEDKDSAQHNAALKRQLGTLIQSRKQKANLQVIAVADVSSYDYWPAKGFVKDAIKAEQRKSGTTIYCDWSGAFGTALKMKRGVSNVVLIGTDGRVVAAHEGVVPAAGREKIVRELTTE